MSKYTKTRYQIAAGIGLEQYATIPHQCIDIPIGNWVETLATERADVIHMTGERQQQYGRLLDYWLPVLVNAHMTL